MRIGELARRTGVSTRALRYYEEQGLLVPRRSATGQRVYSEAAEDRVRLLRQLYAAGLSSRTIMELEPHVVDGQGTPELLDRLAGEQQRLNELIDGLAAKRTRLQSVITGATDNVRTGRKCRGQELDAPHPTDQ